VPYSELILRDGEQLVLDLHPHWWYFAKALGATVIAVVLAVVVLASGISGTFGDVVHWIVAILVLAALVWLGERYVRWVTTNFILTSDRIIYRRGVVAKKGMEIPLQRINTIFFSQRLFERMLGLGDLKVESASRTGAEVFEDIRKPDKVQHEIYAQMEAVENRGFDRLATKLSPAPGSAPPGPPPPAGGAPASGASVADRIAQLHELHQQGAITDAEFEAKKAELLQQM
jgi:membrane protein YdbS with pleckstrin-like domain